MTDHQPADGARRAVAVLLHPHPGYGGNRFNHVIATLFAGLPPAGIEVVRFDFASSDPPAAVAQTAAVIASVSGDPLVLVGYSYGAEIAACVDDQRVAARFLIAPPLRLADPAAIVAGRDGRPTGVLVAERDQFSPPDFVAERTARWQNTSASVLGGADHFLDGHDADVLRVVLDWFAEVLGGPAGDGADNRGTAPPEGRPGDPSTSKSPT